LERIMNTRRMVFLVSVFAAAAAADAFAQVPVCGTTEKYNDIYQAGDLKYVQAIFRTQRSISGCAALVRVEGYISGTSAGVHEDAYTAQLVMGRPVQNYGVKMESFSHHWWIWLTGGWVNLGSLHDEVVVLPPNPPPTPREMCEMNGGMWNDDLQYCDSPFSPIIIDTAHDGVRLTSAADGVQFDLNDDGGPEQVAWTRAESDDAWLAMDRNGNGTIDSGAELFGNVTPAYPGGTSPLAANGFEALKFLENPAYGTSIADGVIDRQDAAFARLLLWRDANHNGVSEPDELQPVSQSALLAISKDYRPNRRRDRYGNEFRLKGLAWFAGREGRRYADEVWDVWLRGLPQDASDATP
jgi:hypothetical protein